jgi:hypothetical protein
MQIAKTRLAGVLALATLATGCGGSGQTGPPTPSLYTNANAYAYGVWLHPEQHLGARVQLRGSVRSVTRVGQGVMVALVLPGVPRLIGVHVFDGHFRPRRDEVLQVSGRVRGPLGSPDVPGVPLIPRLHPGTTVIDAQAASIERPAATAAGPADPLHVILPRTPGG